MEFYFFWLPAPRHLAGGSGTTDVKYEVQDINIKYTKKKHLCILNKEKLFLLFLNIFLYCIVF